MMEESRFPHNSSLTFHLIRLWSFQGYCTEGDLEDSMKVAKLSRLLVFLAALLCVFASSASGQCVQCNSFHGIYTCPICHDKYPGYCDGLGCQNGFSCCTTAGCGGCTCGGCSPTRCVTFQ